MNININHKIFTANGEELATYALFHDMIKIMRAADGIEPIGACCGRNTKQIVNSFLNNKQKYFNFMENINTRLIKPLKKGTVYISPIKKMLNYEFMTDNEITLYVKKGYLPDNAFDWTEYNKVQKPTAEETPVVAPIAEEIPVTESPAESPAEVEIPVTESPAESPAEVEIPAMEPTAEEIPAEKPKRSTKRGSK